LDDVIALRGMRLYGRHGANPGERDAEQPFDVDVELSLNLSRAAQSDDLGDTIDYAALHARIRDVVRAHSFALIERLAGAIADELLSDGRVARVRVRVAKPDLLDGATPSITLTRARYA